MAVSAIGISTVAAIMAIPMLVHVSLVSIQELLVISTPLMMMDARVESSVMLAL